MYVSTDYCGPLGQTYGVGIKSPEVYVVRSLVI